MSATPLGCRNRSPPSRVPGPPSARHAQLCGALGRRVTAAGDLDTALEAGLGHDGPALIEIITDPELV